MRSTDPVRNAGATRASYNQAEAIADSTTTNISWCQAKCRAWLTIANHQATEGLERIEDYCAEIHEICSR